jgi:hypothetical protein
MRITRSLFALAALATLGGTAAHAQKRITVGPRLDVNVARVVGDNQDDATSRTGIRIGAWASMDLNQKFSIQPEFVLSGKGSEFPDDDASIKISYLQIPVLAQYRFSTGKTVNPYLLAGPALSFKAGCTLTYEGDDMECNDQTTAVSSTDFGMILGGGVHIGRAQVSLRYDLGLANINGDGDAVVKNRTFSLAVGYGFSIGR